MINYRIKLSKFLSYLLRHAASEYDLKLDKTGFANLGEVLGILGQRFRHFRKEDLFNLVKNDPKGRFEITGDKIRATYGHSIEVAPKAEGVIPPEVLYHGTSLEYAEIILKDGLKPMRRQFVHLSLNEEDACNVGLRHAEKPVILKIMAKEANASGVEFYKEKHVYLAEFVPKDYIQQIADSRKRPKTY